VTDGISTLHPRTNQIQHSEQPPTLITTRANFKGEMLQILISDVTSAGWQVILCDPIWYASSRSGAVLVAQTAIRFLTLPY